MTVEIEVGEIHDRFVGTPGGDLTHSHEPSETLDDFNIHQVRRMEFVLVAKEAGFDSDANRGLQEKLQQRRRVNDDHVDSRSSRITTAAAVFSVADRPDNREREEEGAPLSVLNTLGTPGFYRS